MDRLSVQQVLVAVGEFDDAGGASMSLVAWDLDVEPDRVVSAWERARADGLIRPAGRDAIHDEQLWRLTAGGWAALGSRPRPS